MFMGMGIILIFLVGDVLEFFGIIDFELFGNSRGSFAIGLCVLCIAFADLILILKLYERPEFKRILEDDIDSKK